MNGRPSKELEEAIANLDAFAAASEGEASQLEVQEGKIVPVVQGTLKKTIQLACGFLTTAFPVFLLPRSDEVYETVVQSSEVVKKNATLIHLWEGGTPEQRRFAAHAKSAISRYNKIIECGRTKNEERLYRFFYGHQGWAGMKLHKIDIVPKAPLNIRISSPSSTQFDPLKMAAKVAAKPSVVSPKVSQMRETFLPVQARELFIMKAISLLEKNGIASNEEARLMLRESMVHAVHDAEKKLHVLSVVVHPIPGRAIEIQGAFMGRIPLPDSFQITLRSS